MTGATSSAASSPRTLVLLRHAKSDWDVATSDRERPLAARGRRQAPPAGRWIAEQVPPIDLVILSPARRARETWELAGAELGAQPPTEVRETAYTFDGGDLLAIVRSLPREVRVAAIVGHNPALGELVETLTGVTVPMVTSAVAVVSLADWSSAPGSATLRYAGRPADERPDPQEDRTL